jgi:hypothetical protein
MVINKNKISILAIVALQAVIFASRSDAKVAGSAKPIKEWISKWKAENAELPIGILHRAAVVVRGGGKIGLMPYEMDAFEFNRAGFLQIQPIDEIKFTISLNDRSTLGGTSGCVNSIPEFMTCFKLDSILEIGGSAWTLSQMRGGEIKTILKSTGTSAPSPAEIQKWVAEKSQYDGVILDQDGTNALVAMVPGGSQPGTQGLLLANSENSLVIDSNNKKGAGIFQLSEREGGFAIMKILMTEFPGGRVPKGTKFVLQRSK